jgi:DNA-binding transcriptional ArsR family regulator
VKFIYMSYLKNSNISKWDPSRLQLDVITRAKSATSVRHRRRPPIKDRYVRGPIPVAWLGRAGQLGGAALLVGLALWYLYGLRKTDTFIVSNLTMESWGVRRDAKSRGLQKLAAAGLIKVERREKRSPQVTLVVES